ncbi:hypothetical protein Hdeb2414_s0018g00528821 [Helianthus debilis subsp. tardiflorus]
MMLHYTRHHEMSGSNSSTDMYHHASLPFCKMMAAKYNNQKVLSSLHDKRPELGHPMSSDEIYTNRNGWMSL